MKKKMNRCIIAVMMAASLVAVSATSVTAAVMSSNETPVSIGFKADKKPIKPDPPIKPEPPVKPPVKPTLPQMGALSTPYMMIVVGYFIVLWAMWGLWVGKLYRNQTE